MDAAYVAVIAGIAVVAFLIGWISVAREHERFDERYPPITDEEFLRRCSPGVRPEVALRVRKLVSQHLGADYERIHPETKFVELTDP